MIRRLIKRLPVIGPMSSRIRPGLRGLRTRWLRRRYPDGGFLTCHGVPVFCDFEHPSYEWYDTSAPNLAVDQAIVRRMLELSDGNVVIDIGAHFGFFAAFLAASAPARKERDWRVIAVEPDPRNFRCLTRTAARAGAAVTTVAAAVDSSDGMLTLYSNGSACLQSFSGPSGAGRYDVRGVKLDTLMRELLVPGDRVAFVKMDVDGAEPAALAGARETLAAHRPIVLMEYCPLELRRAGTDPQGFLADLTRDFHVYWVAYHQRRLRRVTASDYDEIAEATGDRITDFVLTSAPLPASEIDWRF